jgi:hypothetical protein
LPNFRVLKRIGEDTFGGYAKIQNIKILFIYYLHGTKT